ncbi:MAG TPA: DUF1553 domain-containing protein [Fimbriiglobus sp.]|jgi:hypothetical protein
MALFLIALGLGISSVPIELTVTPAVVELTGPRDVRQILVSERSADGRVSDRTHAASATADPPGVVAIDDGLFLRAVRNGVTTVTISDGGRSARVKVTVTNASAATAPSFRHDVVAAMNVGGCNAGACHGTPSGKNGFKLSLRGFDPAADFLQLTRDQFGRRTDALNPAESLILLKALGRITHEGGSRFTPTSVPSRMISAWLAAGMPDDPPKLPPITKVTVLGARVQLSPATRQQLAVVASFSNGTTRDVTRLTCFSSSDPGVADVTATGRVDFKRPGEVAILCRYLQEMVSVRMTYLDPRPGFVWPDVKPNNFVDTHVFAKLKTMTIAPSALCTDAEFVRRAYLDATGRLPTSAEAKSFEADTAATKRARLVDHLLTLPEFADFWALKWEDVLRSSRKTVQLKGSVGLQSWLRDRFDRNVPFDRTVRDILTASGNTSANPPANYYRIAKDPQSLGETTAQLFLGVRMQCAKCHNHPFERWTQDDYYGLAAWFARVNRKPLGTRATEVVYVARTGDVSQPRSGRVMMPHFPGAGDADVPPGEDRRATLAAWLTSPGNPFFAKSVANRVWFHLMGRGIVDPVDDFRDSNPASNDDLLAALATDFESSGFDLKHLVATIMKSRTYQLSAVPNESNADDAKYFSHAVTKLLTAEQLLDAVCDVTGVPEKFAGLPAGTRAVQLPDGEVNNPFLKTFGQPAREIPCECERESDGNLGQALQLINGPTVNEKVRAPNNRLGPLLKAKTSDADILADLYFAALSRPPLPEESKAALAHIAKNKDRRKAWEDVLWAVINTREFLFRH